MAQIMDELLAFERPFFGMEGEWLRESIQSSEDSLEVEIINTRTCALEGAYRKVRGVVEVDNLPPWYVLPSEDLRLRLHHDQKVHGKHDSRPSQAVLVSRVRTSSVLSQFKRPEGADMYLHFGHCSFSVGQPLAAMRRDAMGKMGIPLDSKVSVLKPVYVPETAVVMHMFELLPLDYDLVLGQKDMTKLRQETYLQQYFQASGGYYHSAKMMPQAEPYVKALAKVYEQARQA